MRMTAMGLLVPVALAVGACQTADEPEDVEVPPAAEQAQLEQLQGSGVTGEIHVTPRDNETHFVVHVRNAAADESFDARIHSGTCQNPGAEIRNIGSIRTTDMGEGAIDTTVGEAPGLILDGNHIAVIWGPTHDDTRPGTTVDPTMRTDTPATGTPAPGTTDTRAGTQTGTAQDVGLVRDGRRAVACTTLPRHGQTGVQQY